MVIDKFYAAAFHYIWQLALNRYFIPLYETFGSWEEAWKSKVCPAKIPLALWDQFISEKKAIDPFRLREELERKKIGIIMRTEEGFSKPLLQISNIPCILYYCGDLSLLQNPALAVVGSRSATSYGLAQARHMSARLAASGLTIISGLARGIDTQAHLGALDAQGKTIAVLGSGLNFVYPHENQALFYSIKEKGLLISEFPPGTPPHKKNFPQRNRIISGLSLGVFVAEAQARSGSLITSDFALEQGREVFALPGLVTNPNSIGTLRLIQNGAKLVITPEDILDELPVYGWATAKRSLTEAEKELLGRLSWDPVAGDTLLNSQQDSRLAEKMLVKLESMGLVKRLPGKYYVRTYLT